MTNYIIGVTDLPLVMGDKIIGRCDLDYITGELTARIDKKLVEMVAEGLGSKMMSISFFGRPSSKAPEIQEELRAYLEGPSNLDKAKDISNEITNLRAVQKALKDAFHHRELDGGPKAALEHPLFAVAEARVAELQEELTLLV